MDAPKTEQLIQNGLALNLKKMQHSKLLVLKSLEISPHTFTFLFSSNKNWLNFFYSKLFLHFLDISTGEYIHVLEKMSVPLSQYSPYILHSYRISLLSFQILTVYWTCANGLAHWRWSYTGRFATKIFSALQRCNVVTMLQGCVALLIVVAINPCNIILRVFFVRGRL